MRLSAAERREIRSGRPITRRMRLKSTGEVLWVEITTMWDNRYFRVGDGPWCRTVSEAARKRS